MNWIRWNDAKHRALRADYPVWLIWRMVPGQDHVWTYEL